MEYFLGFHNETALYNIYNDLLPNKNIPELDDDDDFDFQYCPKCKTWTFIGECAGPIYRIYCDYGEKYWYLYCNMCCHSFITDIAPYTEYDEQRAKETKNDIMMHMHEIGNPKCIQQKIITNEQERKKYIQYLFNYLNIEKEEDKQLFLQKFSKIHLCKTQIFKIKKIVIPMLFDIVREKNVTDEQMKEFINQYFKYYKIDIDKNQIQIPTNIEIFKDIYKRNQYTIQKMKTLYPNFKIEPCVLLDDENMISTDDKHPIFNGPYISNRYDGIYSYLNSNQIYIKNDDFFFDMYQYLLPESYIEIEDMNQWREWTLLSGD